MRELAADGAACRWRLPSLPRVTAARRWNRWSLWTDNALITDSISHGAARHGAACVAELDGFCCGGGANTVSATPRS